jgi:AcrR family transcriptional regulator
MLKQDILNAASRLAQVKGYRHVTREDVARSVECAESTISYHFGTMVDFHNAIVEYAVANEVLEVVADALAAKNPIAVAASDTLRRKAVRHLADSLR